MLTLDGIEYEIKTPEENASDLVTYINTYCQDHGVKNSKGEIISVEENVANPFYMWIYGQSYLTTILQKLIYNAGCTLSIPEASERQLLNLADIAGIKRRGATKTTIQGTVYASTEEGCVITTEDTVTLYIGNQEVIFHPAFDIEINENETHQIIFVAERYGAFNISANTITAFDEEIPGLRRLETLASIPGQNEETIANLRSRIQRRSVEGTQVDKAAEAIQGLEGVSLCNIYFNYSPSVIDYVGSRNIPVLPRTALVLVQGWSMDENAIAKMFYRYLTCQTSGITYVFSSDGITYYTDPEMTEEAIIPTGVTPIQLNDNTRYFYINIENGEYQIYTTKAFQQLPMCIVPPIQVPVHVRVYIKNTLSYNTLMQIKDTICTLSSSITIAQEITSVMVTELLTSNFKNILIQGADIGIEEERTHYVYSNDGEVFYEDPDCTPGMETSIPVGITPIFISGNKYRYVTSVSWDYKQAPASDAVFTFNIENIEVIEITA